MSNTINTFIIYAREDKEIKERLLAHINPFRKVYDLVLWHDEYLVAGQEWKPRIESRLEQTDLFLLLVSVDFMNSEFINQVEFKSAIERHKAKKSVVVPIIINYCQWDIDFRYSEYNFNLKELHVLPQEGIPIDEWKTREKAYNDIAAGIRKVLETIKAEKIVEGRTHNAEDKIYTKVEIEAGFPGGENAWREYLRNNLNADTPVKFGANVGKYTAIVKFVVNKDGSLSDVQCESDPGYGMGVEAMRVIKKTPKWTPAIQNGRYVEAYRRQPITFIIEEE
jgi:hypothetical protein